MGRTRISIALVAIIGIVLSILTVAPARSAEAQVFAAIDLDKAFNDYTKKQDLDKQFQSEVQGIQSKLELRQTHSLLNTTEFEELSTLKAKVKPTDAEKKRIEELETSSTQRVQELQALRQKTTPTDAEKTRMAALQDQTKQTDAELKEIARQADADLQKRRYELSKQVMDEVQAAVAAVAKSKGITMVFNKSVGETVLVVFSTNDITDEVLKKLNKT